MWGTHSREAPWKYKTNSIDFNAGGFRCLKALETIVSYIVSIRRAPIRFRLDPQFMFRKGGEKWEGKRMSKRVVPEILDMLKGI